MKRQHKLNSIGGIVALCSFTVAATAQDQTAPTFEVASVKPSADERIPATAVLAVLRLAPDQWRAIRVNLVQLLAVAHPAYAFEGRIVGGPAWIREALFDIEARKDPKTSLAQVAPMMAHLLANRFSLRTHVEQRAIDVYVLKMARSDGQLGPHLKRSAASCIEAKTARQPPPSECRGTPPVNGMNLPTTQIADFLRYLSFVRIDRPVLDRTGLTGYLDFQLRYDYGPFGGLYARQSSRTDGVSFFTALQEQLGLKLEPAREVVDVLVIDSVDRPTPD
jgi:uncharacterized protein (TIGR03435 family)